MFIFRIYIMLQKDRWLKSEIRCKITCYILLTLIYKQNNLKMSSSLIYEHLRTALDLRTLFFKVIYFIRSVINTESIYFSRIFFSIVESVITFYLNGNKKIYNIDPGCSKADICLRYFFITSKTML